MYNTSKLNQRQQPNTAGYNTMRRRIKTQTQLQIRILF